MANSSYNMNAKNPSTSYTPLELNCDYHPCVFFKKNTNPSFKSKLSNELSAELQDLIIV